MLHAVGSRESNGSRFSLAKPMSSAYSHSRCIPRSETGGFSHDVGVRHPFSDAIYNRTLVLLAVKLSVLSIRGPWVG